MSRLAWLSIFTLGTLAWWTKTWWSEPAFEQELEAPLALTAVANSPAPIAPLPKEDDQRGKKSSPPAPVVKVERSKTPSLQKTTNVLLVGLDRKPGQTTGGRPDTIVVAAFDKDLGHLGLISVPRDLYVDIPDHGEDRINATFAIAWNRKENAWDLLERVLEDTLQLPIQHRIAVDLSGFESVIDALGGVDVRIPCPIVDNFIDPRTESGRRLLNLDAGVEHLDGVHAALYVRSRHGRSDWSRARRQQAVLLGVKDRFASMDGLAHLPQFYDALREIVNSNMTRAQMFSLARDASELSPARIHGLVLGVKQAAPHYTKDGKAVLLPNYDEIDLALSSLFSRNLPGTRPSAAACPDAKVALRPRKGRVKLPKSALTPVGDLVEHHEASPPEVRELAP